MSVLEVKVPDIGDFKDIPIIEVFVKPGDKVAAEDSLVTLESDKATMDVPSPAAGVVKEVKVKLGDKVSEGTAIVVLDSDAAGAAKGQPAAAVPAASSTPGAKPAPAAAPAPPRSAAPIPGAATYSGKADFECGCSSSARAGRLQRGVPRRRSRDEDGAGRALRDARRRVPQRRLHSVEGAAAHRRVMDETKTLAEHGIAFGAPKIDLDGLRGWKDKVVGKLTGGLAGMAKARKVEVVRGVGAFLDPHHVEVEQTEGPARRRRARRRSCASSTRSSPPARNPCGCRSCRKTRDIRFDRRPGPRLGPEADARRRRRHHRLEMGTGVLVARVAARRRRDARWLMAGADRDLVKVWEKINKPRFDRMMLGTKTTAVEAKPDALYVKFEARMRRRSRSRTTRCCSPWAAARTARRSAPRRRASRSPTAGSSPSTTRCAPTSRTSTRSAISSASRCSHTRRRTRATSPAEAAAGEKAYFDARVIPSVRVHRP
jgi:dihydrolipoamide dehydrogenase